MKKLNSKQGLKTTTKIKTDFGENKLERVHTSNLITSNTYYFIITVHKQL